MPPADGSSTVAKIVADLRPSADASAVRTSLVAGGGNAAGSQRAHSLGSCAMGQTHGRMQNAQLRRGGITNRAHALTAMRSAVGAGSEMRVDPSEPR